MMQRFQLASVWILVLVLVFTANADDGGKKKLLLLGQSPDGHPRSTHEYLPGVLLLAKCLSSVPQIEASVVRADDPWTEGPELLRDADGVVMFLSEGAKWTHGDARRLEAFAQLAARGGSLVTIHWGMGTKEARYIDGYLKLFGGCHGGPDRKYQVVQDAMLEVVDRQHPITTGIDNFKLREEFYYKLKFVKSGSSVQPILRTLIDGQKESVAWAWQRPDGGRSFGFSGGHFHDNWAHEQYRRLVAQAILWTLQVDVPKDGLSVEVADEDLQLKPPKS